MIEFWYYEQKIDLLIYLPSFHVPPYKDWPKLHQHHYLHTQKCMEILSLSVFAPALHARIWIFVHFHSRSVHVHELLPPPQRLDIHPLPWQKWVMQFVVFLSATKTTWIGKNEVQKRRSEEFFYSKTIKNLTKNHFQSSSRDLSAIYFKKSWWSKLLD